MSKVCNKQFITLSHCEIWSHFTLSLYLQSPSARENTKATREISSYFTLNCVISLIGRAKRAPHRAVQSRFRVICRYVCWFVYKKYACQNVWVELRGPNTRMLKVSFGQLKPTCDTRIIHFYSYARAALAWTKKKPKKMFT